MSYFELYMKVNEARQFLSVTMISFIFCKLTITVWIIHKEITKKSYN